MISKITQQWINAHPESENPLDRERWYNATLESFRLKENIDFEALKEYIKQHKKWNEEFIIEFLESKERDYFLLKEFYDYCLKNQ